MKARLVILVVVALVMGGVYLTTRGQQEYTGEEAPPPSRDITKTILSERELPGEEPPEPVDISVRMEVDQLTGKNQINFFITEAHGYYVETFRIEFWYQPDGVAIEPSESPSRFTHYVNNYLKSDETFASEVQVVPAELDPVGGDMGTDENWGLRLVSHGRARVNNPNPLPRL